MCCLAIWQVLCSLLVAGIEVVLLVIRMHNFGWISKMLWNKIHKAITSRLHANGSLLNANRFCYCFIKSEFGFVIWLRRIQLITDQIILNRAKWHREMYLYSMRSNHSCSHSLSSISPKNLWFMSHMIPCSFPTKSHRQHGLWPTTSLATDLAQ